MNFHESFSTAMTYAGEGDDVIAEVCSIRGIERSAALGPSQSPIFAQARFDIMARLSLLGWSPQRIGNLIKRDRTTVIDGLERWASLLANGPIPLPTSRSHRARASTGVWSPAAEAIIRDRWEHGWSATMIAEELGSSFSRNAVIGKIHRLKLPKPVMKIERIVHAVRRAKWEREPNAPAKVEKSESRRNFVKPPRPSSFRPKDIPLKYVPARDIPPPLSMPDTDAFGAPAAILALQIDTCRWPIGDPHKADFRFCCAPATTARPYCPYHYHASVGRGTDSERRATDLRRVPATMLEGALTG